MQDLSFLTSEQVSLIATALRNKPIAFDAANRQASVTIDQIMQIISDNNIIDIETLFLNLPRMLEHSSTLMETTLSRHRASLEYPRIIMYGVDARFLFSASTDPQDPLYNIIEMAELDMVTGRWIFATIEFGPKTPVLSTDDTTCQLCHGNPARPIWGAYPFWPGAFGERDNRLTSEQINVLDKLNNGTHVSERLNNLTFNFDTAFYGNGGFSMATRNYGLVNSVFGIELAYAVADGLAKRLSLHPEWDERRYDLIQSTWCNDDLSASGEIFKQMGIDRENDFQLDRMATDTYSYYGWSQGSTGLGSLLMFRVIDLVAKQDPDFKAAIGHGYAMWNDYISHLYELRGEDRADWRKINGLKQYDLRPENASLSVEDAICQYIESRN
jgi:hypothetical protein